MFSRDRRRAYRRATGEITRIALRHIFLPINAIVFVVVILLLVFGEVREGIFLGAIVVVNIGLGFAQDVRAWLTLERLQFLTALTVTRRERDGSESHVPLEKLGKGDEILLRLGDQMPCDGVLLSGSGIEVSEGLITGESRIFARREGQAILAGSVITAGRGVARLDTSFAESRIAKMATGLKRYSANPSPIQVSIATIIRYTTYVLLVVLTVIAVRGELLHQGGALVVEQIGALAGILVPQGLVVAVTLLFTIGAAHYYRRDVLLQEVNATEKFGRVKNLCMDKTGTLTENAPTVEDMLVGQSVEPAKARSLVSLYAHNSSDLSLSIRAIADYLGPAPARKILEDVPFSSWRSYGGVRVEGEEGEEPVVVMVGAPEALAPHISDTADRAWLEEVSRTEAKAGKHVLAAASCQSGAVPHALEGSALTALALFVLENKLREGIRDAVDFFQKRGVTIRILSGDHPDTAQAVAKGAGINRADMVITGKEMEGWNEADFVNNASKYAIFARIQPEQKERLVDALRRDGFTAMVGDGANDALSVKKADLGIAMFDGATATRQIAAVVLLKNSFIELPRGVRLADSMIENIEIFASIYLNQTFLGFLLFLGLFFVGSDFPLLPLNISFINYFTVGIPGILISWWALNPAERTVAASSRPFLERVLPFTLIGSLVQAVCVLALYALGRVYVPSDTPASLIIISFAVLGMFFFALAVRFYSQYAIQRRMIIIFVIGIVEAVLLYAGFHIPIILLFFGIMKPSMLGTMLAAGSAVVFGLLSFALMQIPRLRNMLAVESGHLPGTAAT